MTTRVLGMFNDWDHANAAMNELERMGYGNGNTSVVVRESSARTYLGDGNREHVERHDEDMDGAATGAALGGLAGALAGVGALAIPGIGPLFVAGPIASVVTSTLAGAAVGTVEGGLIDAFADVDEVEEDQARYYAEGVRRGGIVVATDTDNPSAVRDVLSRNGAVDLDSEPDWDSDAWS